MGIPSPASPWISSLLEGMPQNFHRNFSKDSWVITFSGSSRNFSRDTYRNYLINCSGYVSVYFLTNFLKISSKDTSRKYYMSSFRSQQFPSRKPFLFLLWISVGIPSWIFTNIFWGTSFRNFWRSWWDFNKNCCRFLWQYLPGFL